METFFENPGTLFQSPIIFLTYFCFLILCFSLLFSQYRIYSIQKDSDPSPVFTGIIIVSISFLAWALLQHTLSEYHSYVVLIMYTLPLGESLELSTKVPSFILMQISPFVYEGQYLYFFSLEDFALENFSQKLQADILAGRTSLISCPKGEFSSPSSTGKIIISLFEPIHPLYPNSYSKEPLSTYFLSEKHSVIHYQLARIDLLHYPLPGAESWNKLSGGFSKFSVTPLSNYLDGTLSLPDKHLFVTKSGFIKYEIFSVAEIDSITKKVITINKNSWLSSYFFSSYLR